MARNLSIQAESEWKSMDRLGMPSFPLASQTAQLQAADLLVHLIYQRGIQCAGYRSWQTAPKSELLAKCIRNSLHPDDHTVFTKDALQNKIDLHFIKASVREALNEGIKRISGLQ